MALNFPSSPTDGQVYTDTTSGNRWAWDSANTAWKSTSTFTQTITVASTAPASPVVGQLWWNRDYGRLLVYYNDGSSSQWVDASPSDHTSSLAYNTANSAFGIANNAFANTTGTFHGNLSVAGDLSTVAGNLAISTATTNTKITVTATSGGGQMLMQSFGGTLGTLGSTNNIPVELITNNARRMYIDTNGYVTKPNQPMVIATKSTHTQASFSPVIFDNVVDQTGSCYNATNGIFTAPVAGWYYVSYCTILWNMGSASYTWIYKNGSSYGPTSLGTYGSFTGTYAGQGSSLAVKAAAGDSLGIGFTYNGTYMHGGYTALSIGLIC